VRTYPTLTSALGRLVNKYTDFIPITFADIAASNSFTYKPAFLKIRPTNLVIQTLSVHPESMSNSLLLFLTLINMVPFINSLGTHLTPAGLSEELATVNNSSILHDVHPYPDSVFVPVSYCYEKFGHDYTPYPAREAFQGITGWIVPLLVLVGNMYMPHFATTSLTVFHFFAVTGHLLADPIDSIYSLGIKLRMRRMIYYTICTIRQADPALEHTMDDEVVGQLRTILFALHDYLGTDPVHPSTIATLIQGWNNNPIAVCRAADRLKDHRVKNTRRVVLAIAVYIASLVTAWERTKNDPPLYFLHTIALRELYYWLLPAIVLSCMAGGFPTDKTVKWVLEDNDLALTLGLRDQKFQPWNGGTYSFAVDRSMDLPKFWLLVLAFLAVGFAWASAFAMSWISPTKGLECRGMLQLTYLGTWVINCGVNWGLYAVLKWIMGWNEGRLRRWKLSWLVGNTEDRLRRWWICVMSKDIFLGAAMLGILLGAFKGELLTNC